MTKNMAKKMQYKSWNVVYSITNTGRSFFFLKQKITIEVPIATRHISEKIARFVT